MEKVKSTKQINALFRTRIQSYIRHHEKELNSFAKIPWGYGMRATHRLKHFSDKSTEIRSALEDMVKHYTIDEKLHNYLYYKPKPQKCHLEHNGSPLTIKRGNQLIHSRKDYQVFNNVMDAKVCIHRSSFPVNWFAIKNEN